MSHTAFAHCIIGSSPPMRRLRALIERVAPSGLPVLILGPTGSGKELVAQTLHAASRRRGCFVAFNVCAISDTMFEDALFGHVRGAFTGATSDACGYLAEAHQGTVFLDEISGLALAAQAKLLRAIETRQFRPVGARQDRRSDFRVVAATNEDLDVLVPRGHFRADLAHRLSGIVIEVPPLRERLEDIPELVTYFLQEYIVGAEPIQVTAGGIRALQDHDWPGNIRELRHVIECASTLSERSVLGREEITAALRRGGRRSSADSVGGQARRSLLEVLESYRWDTAKAARHLGVHRATVYRRMRRWGIAVPHAGVRDVVVGVQWRSSGVRIAEQAGLQ